MPSSACVRCGIVCDSLDASGLCTLCLSRTDETNLIHPSQASTASRPPTDADTHTDGPGGWADALPPGGYRYEEKLGEGGMGEVWRVVRVSTGQVLAIKKLLRACFTPLGLRRFVAEARVLAVIDHPNVVRLYDFLPDPADPLLVMEFVPGQSLSRHLKEIGPLHPDRAARLIAAAARGVQAAHDIGVIHRDLKPSNLLLTPDGRVKVVDFGLGKRLFEEEAISGTGTTDQDSGDTPATVTRTGRLAGGTPGFMAPEQASEEYGRVDRPADVWGLGACLYALLTGRSPFPGGRANLGLVISDPLVPLRQVNPALPADLAAIVERCLEKDPARRYPTAAAVADDLDRYIARDSTAARPKPWAVRVWQRLRRTPRVVVLAVMVAVLAVAVGGSLAMMPWRKDDPLTAAQKKLQSGEELVLVDAGQFLLPPKWLVADAVLADPTAEEPFTSFASRDVVAVQLLADPGLDRYRITAQVKQLPAAPGTPAAINTRNSLLGVFWAYRESALQDGWRARAFMALGYNDFRPPNLKANPRMSVYDIGLVDSPLDLLSPSKRMGPNGPLDFVPELPGPTRTLTVDVEPDQIMAHLPNGPRRLTSPDLDDSCLALEQSLRGMGNGPGRVFGTEKWSPRSPVGVFVDRTRVAVERFVITPLPPK